MIATNNKISIRQINRLMTFDLLGISTLIIPSILAGFAAGFGIISIIFGLFFSYIYLSVLMIAINKKQNSIAFPKIICGYLSCFSIILAAFCLRIFVRLIIENLVYETDYKIVMILILLVSVYSISGGIESRARCYEVLFLIVIIPLVLMMMFAIKDIKIEYVLASIRDGINDFKIKQLLSGAYLVFVVYISLFYLVFLSGYVKLEQRKEIKSAATKALGISGGILIFLYMILVGVFGYKALAKMSFPVVTLMSTIQIKGSFVKRMDAIMLGVWFFTLFASVNLFLFYAAKLGNILIDGLFSSKNKTSNNDKKNDKRLIGYAVIIGVFSLLLDTNGEVLENTMKYIWKFGVPILILIPIVLIFTGSKATALENRCFPMTAAVDYKDEKVWFFYGFPRAGIKSTTGMDASCIKNDFSEGESFDEARNIYEKSVNKKVDNNHMKVLVIGEDYFSNDKLLKELVENLEDSNSFPRNSYVCITKNINQIMKFDENISTDVGSYIEEYLEIHSRENDKTLVTLGDLIDELSNRERTLYIPYLEIEKDSVRWTKDCLLKKGKSSIDII